MRSPPAIGDLKAATALIECGGIRGTGYLLQPDCVFTCYHVIQTALPDGCVSVRFVHGEYQARVVLVDAENDCAVLRLAKPVGNVSPLRLATGAGPRGRKWESYGFPAATFSSGLLISGEVQDGDGENLRNRPALLLHSQNVTAGALMQGFSGSPVVADGLVIGQLQQIVPDERSGAQFGVLYATPALVLSRLLPTYGAMDTSPYRGLGAFQQEDARLFFGREVLVTQLVQAYRSAYLAEGATRLLAVLGPSGAGKSSVVRAGLLPALHHQPVPGPAPLRIALLKPGEHPVEALARALLRVDEATPSVVPDISALRRLRQALRQPDEQGNYDGLRLVAGSLVDIERRPLLIVIDQLEEIYTLCQDAGEREAFVALLLDAAGDTARHVMVVVTLRSDYLGETLTHHRQLNQAIARHAVIVPAMSDDELRRAISEPAATAGHCIDAATVELLLAQARGSEGTLPLLEFALTRIWDGLRAGRPAAITLREIGGVGGALAGRAQDLYDALDPSAQRIAKRALLRLSHLPEGQRTVRRRLQLAELCGHDDSEAQVLDTLRHFSRDQARLLTLSTDLETDSVIVEVTHEALFENWALCRRWLAENRDDQRLHQRITAAAHLWAAADRAPGRLWRPPDLELLLRFQRQRDEDLTQLEREFFVASAEHFEAQRLAKEAADRQLAQMYEQMRQQVLATYVEHGRQELLAERPQHAALRLHRAYQQGCQHPMLPYLLALAVRSLDSVVALLRLPGERIRAISFSTDGSLLLVASDGQLVQVWDVASWQLVAAVQQPGGVRWARFSPDGVRLLTTGGDLSARLWEARTGKSLTTWQGHAQQIRVAGFSLDGQHVVTASEDGSARLTTADGKLLAELCGHGDSIWDVCFSPDGARVATAGADGTVRLWSVPTGQPIRPPLRFSGTASVVSFSPCGTCLAVVTGEVAQVFDASGDELLAQLHGHAGGITSACWSPDSERLLTTAHDGSARLWAARSGKLIATMTGHTSSVVQAAFSPDGQYILTASWDHTARLWEAQSGRFLCALRGHSKPVVTVAFSPDAVWASTGGDDGIVRVWSLDQVRQEIQGWRNHAMIDEAVFTTAGDRITITAEDGSADLCFVATGHSQALVAAPPGRRGATTCSPSGAYVATATRDHKVKILPVAGHEQMTEIVGLTAPITAIRFSPDEARVATIGAPDTVMLWAACSGDLLAQFSGRHGRIQSALFCRDGTRLATVNSDSTVEVWATQSGQALAELIGHIAPINMASFSPDGLLIATASEDRTARIWEADTGRLLYTLSGHDGGIVSVRYSPDGALLVTASRDDTARVWNPRSGKLTAELTGHLGYVSDAVFDPDGHRIATASRDGTARLWEARTGNPIAVIPHPAVAVRTVAFSPDGALLLTTTDDRTARLWSVAAETRSAAQLAALLHGRSAYRFVDDTLVPEPPEPAAYRAPPPAAQPLKKATGLRLLRLATNAWLGGRRESAKHLMLAARDHFLAMEDLSFAGIAAWTQAIFVEAGGDPVAAELLYAEALALLRRSTSAPQELGRLLMNQARFAQDGLRLPLAALRARDAALAVLPELGALTVSYLEVLLSLGRFTEAKATAEKLLPSGPPAGRRAILASFLGWMAARLGGDGPESTLWAERAAAAAALPEASGELSSWVFTGIRHALLHMTPPPAGIAEVLKLIHIIEKPWTAAPPPRLIEIFDLPRE